VLALERPPPTDPQAKGMIGRRSDSSRATAGDKSVLGPAILLLAIVLLDYWPAMRGGFLWDDDAYVHHNPTLTLLTAPGRIWLGPGATPQYYALVFTTFWFEWRLWGGYHVLNCFLHGFSPGGGG